MTLQEEYREIGKLAGALDFAGAVARADRVIAESPEPTDVKSRGSLNAIAMVRLDLTAQTSSTEVPHVELVGEADRLYSRCASEPAGLSPYVALAALRIKVRLLLSIGDEGIGQLLRTVSDFYEDTEKCDYQRALAKEVLKVTEAVSVRGFAPQGVELAKSVRTRLTQRGDEVETAAAAQLWIVIALAYDSPDESASRERTDSKEAFTEFVEMSEDELAHESAAALEANRCRDLGEVGVRAADQLIRRFDLMEGFTRAEAVTLVAKVNMLDALGATERRAMCIKRLTSGFKGTLGPAFDAFLRELETVS